MDTLTQQNRIEMLLARMKRIDRRIGKVRLLEASYPWFRLTALLAWLIGTFLGVSLTSAPVGWIISFILLVIFILITIAHRRVIAALERYKALSYLTSSRIARCCLDWPNIPAHFPIEVSPDHPFDRDLIVTGPRSLHHLVDTTSSTGSSTRLASWLLEQEPDIAQVLTRQNQVRELLNLPCLRARLALDSALVAYQGMVASLEGHRTQVKRWDGETVIRWLGQENNTASLRFYLVILSLLAAANITLFFLNVTGILPAWWVITLMFYLAIQSFKFRESGEVFGEAYDLSRRLQQLGVILSDLETYPFKTGSELDQLCKPFQKASVLPSRILRQAGLIATAASIHGNPFLALALNLLVPWDLFFAYQLERFKDRLRHILPTWLEAWYSLEALSALAEFANLNPGSTFPELLTTSTGFVLDSTGIGHPLIPHSVRVTNSFSIDILGRVILITGSNMSGKSTFLRTVGANLCLAYAGSVVSASSLKAIPMRLFASMNVVDSLNDGISYFYAEVRRLKALLDALQSRNGLPLFFLIDEIFRGTNNRERRVGSESYLRAIAGKNGTGLISTHDLDLVRLEHEIPQIYNYHFREDVEGDRMVFDYRLRPGPSPTTNALRIMALAGLPVQTENE